MPGVIIKMNQEDVATIIIDAALKVHRSLGPGLFESAYQLCLAYELRHRGLQVECEVALPITYEGIRIEAGYRIDMVIENQIIIENKTVEQLLPIHEAQIMTYIKLSKTQIGFLINWNVRLIKNGIKRIVSNVPEPTWYGGREK